MKTRTKGISDTENGQIFREFTAHGYKHDEPHQKRERYDTVLRHANLGHDLVLKPDIDVTRRDKVQIVDRGGEGKNQRSSGGRIATDTVTRR